MECVKIYQMEKNMVKILCVAFLFNVIFASTILDAQIDAIMQISLNKGILTIEVEENPLGTVEDLGNA